MSSNMKFSCPSESVIDIIRSKRPDCTWIQKETIGKGAQGEVFKVCCQETNECDYVVKFYEPVQTTETKFKYEVNVHTEFEELGIAVPIIEAFYCRSHGSYIIMEKRGMNINQYICHLYKKGVPQRIIFDVIDQLYKELLSMLELAYDNNLLHGDSNLDNFMLDPVDEYDYANLTIIDFGKAGIMPNEDRTFDERHEKYNIIQSNGTFKSDSILVLNRKIRDELITDFKMSFDMLKKAVVENRVCGSNPILKAPEKKRYRSMLAPRELAESPARSRSNIFDSVESPARSRSNIFDSVSTPSPLNTPTDINQFRSIQPLSNRLFNSIKSSNIKYDDFKQL